MRKGAYIESECNGITVEGGCLIVDRNRLYIKMRKPYDVSQTVNLDLEQGKLTESEEGEEKLFDYAETILAQMYETIKIVERNQEMFQNLYVNFENMVDGQEVRLYKKIFYSDTEREYFIRDMEERIYESYYRLFDKYITSTDKKVLALRNTLPPLFLREIMKKICNMA